MATKTILLDVGGTFIKCSDCRAVHTNSSGSKEDISLALRKAVGPLEGLTGVGVAMPGPFDFSTGTFLMKHKFASVYGEKFSDLVLPPDCQNPPVFRFAHDVAMMLEGAIRKQELQHRNVALVTLGTGLGFCHAIDGKVQYGPTGSPAFSLWNLTTPDGGILEDKVSARGISAEYKRRTGREYLSPLQIANLALSGDEHAIATYSFIGKILGENLHGILKDMEIDTLLIGGQIAISLGLMIQPLQKAIPGVSIKHIPGNSVFHGLSTLFETN